MYRYDENHRKTGRCEEDGPEETTAQRTPLQRGKRSVWQLKKVRINMPDYGKKVHRSRECRAFSYSSWLVYSALFTALMAIALTSCEVTDLWRSVIYILLKIYTRQCVAFILKRLYGKRTNPEKLGHCVKSK